MKNSLGNINKTIISLLAAALLLTISAVPAYAGQPMHFEDLNMNMELPGGWSSFVPGQEELPAALALIDMDKEKLESYCKDYGCILYAVKDDGTATFTIVTGNAKHKNLAGQSDSSITNLMQTSYGMKTLASTLEGKSDAVIYSGHIPFYTVSGSVSSEGSRTFINYYSTISDYRLILFIVRMEDPEASEEALSAIKSVTLPPMEKEVFNWVPVVGILVFLIAAYAFYRIGPHKRKQNQWFY